MPAMSAGSRAQCMGWRGKTGQLHGLKGEDHGHREIKCLSCILPAGTKVLTPGGLRPIDSLKIDDKIIVGSEKGPVETRINDLYSSKSDKLIKVTFSDGTELRSTEIHPYWVVQHGWEPASHLCAGQEVGTNVGSKKIVKVEIENEKIEVYSLLTESGANFYVGDDCIDVAQWASQSDHFLPPSSLKDRGEQE